MNSRFGTNVISILSRSRSCGKSPERIMDSTLIPPLSRIGAAWWKLLASGKLAANLTLSLTTLAAGFSRGSDRHHYRPAHGPIPRRRALSRSLCQRVNVGAHHCLRPVF